SANRKRLHEDSSKLMAKIVPHREIKFALLSDNQPRKNLSNLEEFEKVVRALRKRLGKKSRGEPHLLFRGQENSVWPLATTLERGGYVGMSLSDYYRVISALRPQIETLTGARWKPMPAYHRVEEWMEKPGEFCVDLVNVHGVPGYDYMVYLRHHGFP